MEVSNENKDKLLRMNLHELITKPKDLTNWNQKFTLGNF